VVALALICLQSVMTYYRDLSRHVAEGIVARRENMLKTYVWVEDRTYDLTNKGMV